MTAYRRAATTTLVLLLLVTMGAGCGPNRGASSGDLVHRIQDRGYLIAGVHYDVPLFGELPPGRVEPEGFEVDLVRELARRLVGAADKVEWVRVESGSRIPLLQSGRVDLVMATLTVTDERRAQIDFSDVYFDAGQSLLVKKGRPRWSGSRPKAPDIEATPSPSGGARWWRKLSAG